MPEIQGFQAAELYRAYGWDISNLSPERPWTRDQQEYLVELYERGWTVGQMATEMNRSQGYIVGRLWDMADADIITPKMWGRKARGQAPPGPVEVWA